MRQLFCSLICFVVVAGCSSNAGTPNSSVSNNSTKPSGNDTTSKKLRIAVIPKGTTHIFWKSVHAGAVQAAKDLGNVEILWKGPLLM